MGPRRSQDWRSPSPIMAPVCTYSGALSKMISSPHCAVPELHPNVCESHSKEYESMLLLTNRSLYLRDFLNSLPAVSLNFTIMNSFHHVMSDRAKHIDYFMESPRVRYLRTSCWRIRKLTRSLRSLVRFLIQKQLVRKYRTKHFPCCNLFILYLLRFFNPNQIFTLH